jgi:hypothetical protein
MSQDVKTVMSEWIELKKNLTEARKDLSTLNKREKELRKYIQTFMVEKQIDTVKVENEKVSVKKTKKTGSLTKDTLRVGLLKFFEDDTVRTDACFACVMENLPKKETATLTLTAPKKQA